MEWMDDTESRRLKVSRALDMVKIDGRTRYVWCVDGWPIEDSKPQPGASCKEWVEVSRDGKTGRVSYVNRETRVGLWGETE